MKRIAVIGVIAIFVLIGCAREDNKSSVQGEDAETVTYILREPDEKRFESCQSIYERHLENGTLGSLEMAGEMVRRLGEEGYAVIDQDNQIDMENADKVRSFCQKVKEKQSGELTLIVVLNNGGFSEFEFYTDQGNVYVTAMGWRRKDRRLIHLDFDTDHYQVSAWIYPDNGYLFFEKNDMPGFSGPYSHVAIRVEPLDNKCRELNRKYIWPVGYCANNMFICGWEEGDYGDLDFRDLFEILYRLEDPSGIPYAADSGGDLYQVPGQEFERVMKKYFHIDSRILREGVKYVAGEGIYEFRPRGVYDNAGGSECPYPEVIGYEERADGTIELLVNAVLEEKSLGTAFQHKVVIRPLADGTCQYVSNEVLPSEDNVAPIWYRKRFTEAEWRAAVTGDSETAADSRAAVFEKGYNLPVDEAEEAAARADCEAVMNSVKTIYESADKGDASNVILSDEVVEQMQEVIKDFGNPVPHGVEYAELYNYEKLESFLENAEKGEKGEVVFYEVAKSGSLRRIKFSFDGTDMYALCANTGWNEENCPVIRRISLSRIKKWEYRKKNWFIFEYCVPEPPEVTEIVAGNDMIRVKPFRREYRDIAERYLLPVGYLGNNLFCTDWEEKHMEELDYNALYQYLYAVKYQRIFDWRNQGDKIPGEEFEALMTEFLPIGADELREYAVYDEAAHAYAWAPLGCGNYSPHSFDGSLPEITAVTENPDGTVLLTVETVSSRAGDDAHVRHQVRVRFEEDGKIRYLGNHILDNGLNKIPRYQYRIGRPDRFTRFYEGMTSFIERT